MPTGNSSNDGTMRYWNLTYNDQGRWDEVYAISGRPMNFWQGLIQGGTGSPKGVLLKIPGDSADLLLETNDVSYCNFQRTTQGAILYFKVRLEVYGIPIYKHDVAKLRMEYRKSEAFKYLMVLMMNNGRQIEIACTESNANAWELFLKKTFMLS